MTSVRDRGALSILWRWRQGVVPLDGSSFAEWGLGVQAAVRSTGSRLMESVRQIQGCPMDVGERPWRVEREDDVVVDGMVPPSGTVTFLFTDVEGSTRLWQEHPVEMEVALEVHDAVLREVIGRHRGYVFSTAGDSFAAAFATAQSAVSAAGAIQETLSHQVWPPSLEIRVRIGVHTGESQERGGNYFGTTLNRAARIMGAAHGGQVLLSAATIEVVGDRGSIDLGEHRLKDLLAAEHIWQLGESDFPTLNSLGRSGARLPVQRSSMVGRDEELARVVALIESHRCVTLTGVGGVGKTRLALAAAAELLDRFDDGVFFVELAALADESLIAQVVGEAAGLRLGGTTDAWSRQRVAAAIAGRDLLLVMDNCEHLIDGCAELVDEILSIGTSARVLATSREALDLDGERTLRVSSLEVEGADGETGPAVALLLERARSVSDGLYLGPGDLSTVRELCRQLDGLPLAIELAAPQLAHLTPTQLLARLGDRFVLLSGGRTRRRQRQHTLDTMMNWSWDLLSDTERDLLSGLAAFSGGWGLRDAEAIFGPSLQVPVATVLGDLVRKSLVTVSDDERGNRRFGLLETVRLYAEQRLGESVRAEWVRDRHRDYFAGRIGSRGLGDRFLASDLAEWALQERANLRAGYDWAIHQGTVREAALLAAPSAIPWRSAIGAAEARTRIEALDLSQLAAGDHARLLILGIETQGGTGNLQGWKTWAAQGRALALESEDYEAVALAEFGLAVFDVIPNPDAAIAKLDHALELVSRTDGSRIATWLLAWRAMAEFFDDRPTDAVERLAEAWEASRNNPPGADQLLVAGVLCDHLFWTGNLDAAQVWATRSSNAIGGLASWHDSFRLALLSAGRRDRVALIRHLRDQVTQARSQGGHVGVAEALLPLAYDAAAGAEPARAARLIATADQSPLFNAQMYHHRRKILAMIGQQTNPTDRAQIRREAQPLDHVIASELDM